MSNEQPIRAQLFSHEDKPTENTVTTPGAVRLPTFLAVSGDAAGTDPHPAPSPGAEQGR